MPTSNQQADILDKILASKCFYKSPTSSVLLKFLVQASIDNIDIKESVIGMHLFGDRYEGEKSNARVRVSVYHLRKKLEKYYKSEGINDVFRLTIEKGQYQVTFTKQENKHKTSTNSKAGIHTTYLAVIVVMLVVYFATNRKTMIPIWDSLLSNKKETVMYIGDVYGFLATARTGGMGWQRDFSINSEEEFNITKKTQNLTDNEVRSANYTYVTASEVDAVKSISRLFFEQDNDFSVRLASKIDVKNLKEQNIIFAGPIKTNNQFIQLLAESLPIVKYHNNELYLSEPDSGTFQSLRIRYQKELAASNPSEIAVVSKLKGMHNTQQFLFFSDHDMGVRATAEYFTHRDSLKRFNALYLKDKDEFTAIFLVKGKERVDFGIKLLDVF